MFASKVSDATPPVTPSAILLNQDLCAKIPDVQKYYYICVVGATNVIVDFGATS